MFSLSVASLRLFFLPSLFKCARNKKDVYLPFRVCIERWGVRTAGIIGEKSEKNVWRGWRVYLHLALLIHLEYQIDCARKGCSLETLSFLRCRGKISAVPLSLQQKVDEIELRPVFVLCFYCSFSQEGVPAMEVYIHWKQLACRGAYVFSRTSFSLRVLSIYLSIFHQSINLSVFNLSLSISICISI